MYNARVKCLEGVSASDLEKNIANWLESERNKDGFRIISVTQSVSGTGSAAIVTIIYGNGLKE